MTENALAKEIVDAAFRIHTTLGPRLLESVYDTVLAYELGRRVSAPRVRSREAAEESVWLAVILADLETGRPNPSITTWRFATTDGECLTRRRLLDNHHRRRPF